jgi:hypothetical protein
MKDPAAADIPGKIPEDDKDAVGTAPTPASQYLFQCLLIKLFTGEAAAADVLQGHIGEEEQFPGLLQGHFAEIVSHGGTLPE